MHTVASKNAMRMVAMSFDDCIDCSVIAIELGAMFGAM